MDVLGPLTLQPGDRRVRAVVPGPPAGDSWWVERACARCGRDAAARSGALVVYGPHDSTVPDTAGLCPDCATLLTPFRFAIDLGTVRSITDPTPTGRQVTAFVERVLAMRAEPPADVVWTRARDAHILARRLGTTRTHLALRLRDLGVLTAAEVATTQRPGAARRTRPTHRAPAREQTLVGASTPGRHGDRTPDQQ